jgi:hypothetical protein
VWSAATVTLYSYSEWVDRGQNKKEGKEKRENDVDLLSAE